MNVFAPFTGMLLLPDKAPFGTISPVTLADGRPIATIRWHNWSMSARYEILDPVNAAVLAAGSRNGLGSREFQLTDAWNRPLLSLKLSRWGAARPGTLAVVGGRPLTTQGNWTARQFTVTDEQQRPVARIVNNSPLLSLRPDGLVFELMAPVMSVVHAIGLAQSMRAAVESERGSGVSLSFG
ncbi:hypothetical protein [Dactylosporangium matsuzakiense]|nr:hypothetical protein [Dactylosporangium matsuzakiense]UWZ42382.1 hypothetical protein Dmats_33100 [Dactylosporangium matsuzakiense]